MRLWLMVLALVCGIQASAVELSLEADYQAKEAFLDLNFFSEGRGMIMSPGLIDMYEFFVPGLGVVNRELMQSSWGLVFDDSSQVAGLFNEPYKGMNVGTVGCVVCHSSRAAGQFVVGLGNKNVDVLRMAKDLHRIETWWDGFRPDGFRNASYLAVEDNAMNFAKYLSDDRLGNMTQGLVPIAFIRGWFYRVQNLEVPETSRGQVKIPHLWGYGEKRKVGQFCDGFGDGEEVGWAVAVELAAGQTPEAVRAYYDDVKEAELAMEYFLPPSYPFEHDVELAAQGRKLFEGTCAKCHGTYQRDKKGFPVYKSPKWIPWQVVKTDYERLRTNRDEFTKLVETSPLSDIIRIKKNEDGFFAPRLEGVWSRFPYLHNGSVPTIWDLLQPAKKRPKYFALRDAGELERFDTERLGLKVKRSPASQSRLRRRAIR
ncbi:MAG: hypothetical protein HRT45_13385 [Bdellovibrionales bacterium]|nr:hypothetical protein [Bdellovibrionales bacterium]